MVRPICLNQTYKLITKQNITIPDVIPRLCVYVAGSFSHYSHRYRRPECEEQEFGETVVSSPNREGISAMQCPIFNVMLLTFSLL